MASLDHYLDELGSDVDADALLTRFLEYVSDQGIELYPAQEEAVMELFVGNNVILNTPTGSGKSLVALAAHFRSIALGERSFYTAPIKALVSEKFFDLCRVLGANSGWNDDGRCDGEPRCSGDLLYRGDLVEHGPTRRREGRGRRRGHG